MENCTKGASRPYFDLNIDLNVDPDPGDETHGAIDMYNKLGITEREMKDDLFGNTVDLRDIHSPALTGCWSSHSSPEQGDVHVKGHLKDHLSFWYGIKANQWVISIIRDGYALPFLDLPPKKEIENHKSVLYEKCFVSEQIRELLLTGCVIEASRSDIHVVSHLGVVKNTVKRLILDLRYVNSFLRVSKFKYEDIRTVRDLFKLGDWFFKFDYKSGYHHVDILPSHQKFLGFSWIMDGRKKWFMFSVLPFGLASAPFVFTKI